MRYLLFLLAPVVLAAPVKVWQGTLELPTYEEGPPDPNPSFDIFGPVRLTYPYTLRENLTDRRVNRQWRALFIENEYLKCSILPDLGGHVYTCVDKINGQPMFYANPSIKKARVGYRGAWAAFGIEFNFPVSHNWASLSPVDFAIRQNSDGSASAFVGNQDRVYGTEWMVEIRLRPDSTVIEQRMTLRNPADVRWRYYWWNNAAVEVWNDSRIWYPMTRTASHGFSDIDSWPVDSSGRDLSVIGNHTAGPVSRFIYASREPFMGVYSPKTNAGTVHYADYADVPAKKIWTWGVDPEGLRWRTALSDNNSGYAEVQAGLFRNQETYAFLTPHQTLEFSEYWIPVRGIGGITRANRDAVLHVERSGGNLRVALNVTHDLKGAHVRISGSDETADLTPPITYSRTVPAPKDKYEVELLTADGHVLLRHKEDEFDRDSGVPTGPQPQPRLDTPLERGIDQELNGEYLTAWSTYQEALKAKPGDYELSKAAGRVALNLNRFPDAVRLLTAALQTVSNDPEAAYLSGVAAFHLADYKTARDRLEAAQRQPQFRASARLALARLEAREGRYDGALGLVDRALAEQPSMATAALLRIALLRQLGRTADARRDSDTWLERLPVESAFRFEATQLGRPDPTLWEHLAADPERILNLASGYMASGLYRDGLLLLDRNYPAVTPQQQEPGAVRPGEYPLIAYYRGYCRAQLGQSGQADFLAARKMSTQYVFPKRPDTLPVLQAALASNPDDAVAHFLLGQWYLAAGLSGEAIAEWEQTRQLQPSLPVLHRDLGRTLLTVMGDEKRALPVLEEGMKYDGANVDLYAATLQALDLLGKPASDRVRVLKQFPDPASMPSSLAFELALALGESGDVAQARATLDGRFFAREEGGTSIEQVQQALSQLEALQQARQGHCTETIRDPKSGAAGGELYLKAVVQSACKNTEAAHLDWERAAAGEGAFALAAKARLHRNDSASAVAQLRDVLRRPDRGLSHFYARIAIRDLQEAPVR